MVVSGNESLESILNSLRVVKDAVSPIESNLRRLTKNFEHCFSRVSKNGEFSSGFDDTHKPVVAGSLGIKRNSIQNVVSCSERRKYRVPTTFLVGIFTEKGRCNVKRKGQAILDEVDEFGMDSGNGENDRNFHENCLNFDTTFSFFINGFVEALPRSFKSEKRWLPKVRKGRDSGCEDSHLKLEVRCGEDDNNQLTAKEVKCMPFDNIIGCVFDQLNHLVKFDVGTHETHCENHESNKPVAALGNRFDQLVALFSIVEGKKHDINGFLGNLKFACVGGVASNVGNPSLAKNPLSGEISNADNSEEGGSSQPKNLVGGLLRLPNVERLRSTLSTVSFTELIELLPLMGGRPPKADHPDKKKLFSVQDFFRYTETEGMRFFQELDRDGDGQVTLEDLEVAMRKRKLPKRYANKFMSRTRSHLFSKSFGWKQFLSMMEQKEPTILRAYTSLCLSKSGTLQKSEILASLQNAGLPSNEDNAISMMRFLNADSEESISYGHFRNFMILLPSERLEEDPRSIWFEAATVVSVPPPVEIPAGSVLKSALAGGLSCALSTALLFPIDTVKTRVQASTLGFPEVVSKIPQIGISGLYRGSIPAILGQFSSHGLRTGIFEASKLVMINVAPTLPELQVQSIASFCSTFLGTAVRIPCEVLKQRLQAGLFDNVGEAIAGTWQQDGLRGFFRGTGATLFREVPFYVAGMSLYAESKKAAQKILGRELEPWETIAVGALSGGLTAVITTPFDVMKTRMMTSRGRQVTLSTLAFSILRREGPLGLFKGAVPRFFWIAPVGAMNFAGYELARKAIDNEEHGEP